MNNMPPTCPSHAGTAFAGGDLEHAGVFEAALAARASPTRELIFLSVGDTRDHRRQYKDPQLRTISTDFLLNLLANLRRLGLEHFFILTTQGLCRQVKNKRMPRKRVILLSE